MNTRRLIVTLAPVLVAGCAVRGNAPKAAPPVIRVALIDYPLPSGLRVVFHEDAPRKVVEVATVVGAGAASDPQGKEGLAHLVEHLWFRARPSGGTSVRDRLSNLGASYNAFTADDYTEFVVAAPAGSLDTLLDLEARRLLDPLVGVTEEVFLVEREVVRNEMRERREANAHRIAMGAARGLLFPEGHRYRRLDDGGSLDGLTLEDARAFAAKWYRPANTTILVTGAIDRSTAGGMVTAAFPYDLLAAPGAEPGGPIEVVKPSPRVAGKGEPPSPVPDRTAARIRGPVVNPTVVLAWSVPGAWRGQDAMVEMLAEVMTAAVGRLLYPELSGAERVEGVWCDVRPGVEAGILSCSIEIVEGQDPEKIAERAVDGLWALWGLHGVEWRESVFEGAMEDYMGRIYAESATLSRTTSTAPYVHFTGTSGRFARMFSDLSLDDHRIRRFATKWLTRKRMVTVIVEPFEDGSAPRPMAHTLLPGSSWAGDVVTGSAAATRRDRRAIAAIARGGALPRISDLTLRNGLRVMVARNERLPFVRTSLLTRGGWANRRPLGSLFFGWPWDRGGDPADIFGFWSRRSYHDAEVRAIEAPASNLEAALAKLLEKVRTTKSAFHGRGVDELLDSVERRQRNQLRDPATAARVALLERLLPGHPLSMRAIDRAAISNVKPEELDRWYEDALVPANATLVVVGDVDVAAAEETAIRIWGAWDRKSATEVPPLPDPPTPPSGRRLVVVDARPRTQAELLVGCRLVPSNGREEIHAEVLAAFLQRTLGGRLREATGMTYGVHAVAEGNAGGADLLLVGTTVALDGLEAAVRETLGAIDAVGRAATNDAELEEVLLGLARAEPLRLRSNRDVSAAIIERLRRGQPVEDLSFRAQWLADTTAADLARAVETCAGREIIAIVGPEDEIGTRLSGLGLARE